MGELKIYGAGDDLIECEGEITEEFNPPYNEDSILAFSDGTLLRAEYDQNGDWRFHLLCLGRGTTSKNDLPDDVHTYSEVATLINDNPFQWVVLGTLMARP